MEASAEYYNSVKVYNEGVGKNAALKRNRDLGNGAADSPRAKAMDTSDDAVVALLARIKATDDPAVIRELSDELERLIFHRQFRDA